jgi:hypothetical protein
VIDKADLRIPWGTDFSKEIREIVAQLRHGQVPPFRPSKFYSYVGDLRESHDIDAVLHLGYKYSRGGKANNKLEIIDAGKKTLNQMEATVSRVVDVNVDELQLMCFETMRDSYSNNLRAVLKSQRKVNLSLLRWGPQMLKLCTRAAGQISSEFTTKLRNGLGNG